MIEIVDVRDTIQNNSLRFQTSNVEVDMALEICFKAKKAWDSAKLQLTTTDGLLVERDFTLDNGLYKAVVEQ